MKRIRILALLCTLGILFTVFCCFAGAVEIEKSKVDTIAIAINDYGWVSFEMNVNYTEAYTPYGSSRRFTERDIWWTCRASRDDADVNAIMSPYVPHYNSVGNKIKTYTLTKNVAIWDATLFSAGHYSNTETVSYAATTQNYGKAGYGITGASVVAPYSNTLRINFNS